MIRKLSKCNLLLAFALVLFAVLSLPLSNFFLKRRILPVEAGRFQPDIKEFRTVSAILQNKCADCHSPGLACLPIYAQIPPANLLIEKDMKEAQQNMLFTKERLTGNQPFSKLDLAKIDTVIEGNQMPPIQYKIMHWDTGITKAEKDLILKWLQAQVTVR